MSIVVKYVPEALSNYGAAWLRSISAVLIGATLNEYWIFWQHAGTEQVNGPKLGLLEIVSRWTNWRVVI